MHILDKVVWRPTKGIFTVKSAWDAIRIHHDKVDWASIVWFKHHIPRYSFILWLAIRNSLSTRDKLFSHGLIQSAYCVLCNDDLESHSHLFFKCSYTARLWLHLLGKLGLQCFASTWAETIEWGVAQLSGTSLLQILGKLSFSSLIYFIWRERNARIFQHVSTESTVLMRQLETVVRLRVLSIKPFPKTDCNKHFAQVWCLSPSVLGD